MRNQPAYIQWRGQPHLVEYTVDGGVVTVDTEPKNAELAEAVRMAVANDLCHTLPVYLGFGFNYLMNDPKKGQA